MADQRMRPTARGREHLIALCEPILEAEGYELVDAEWKRGRRGSIVSLYVHRPGGITVGECQKLLRLLQPILQMEGVLDDRTQFNVASPGLDRPLRTWKDFRRAEGYFVILRRRRGETEERLVGMVTGVTEEELTLELQTGEVLVIPMTEIIEGRFDIRF